MNVFQSQFPSPVVIIGVLAIYSREVRRNELTPDDVSGVCPSKASSESSEWTTCRSFIDLYTLTSLLVELADKLCHPWAVIIHPPPT